MHLDRGILHILLLRNSIEIMIFAIEKQLIFFVSCALTVVESFDVYKNEKLKK